MTSPVQARTSDVVGIQYLRALAAAAVVFYHLNYQIQVAPGVNWATSALSTGVDLFFVISGFVMAWSSIGKRLSARVFIERRLIRIVPLYWLITALMLVLLLVAPSLLHNARLAWPHAIGSFLFFPVINPATGLYEPLAIPGWTLIYEMAFYLVFAGAIVVARGVAARTLWLAVLAIVAIVIAGQVFAPTGAAGFYMRPIILEFAYGIAVAVLARRAAPLPTPVLLLIAVVALVTMFWPADFGLDRALRRGIPAALVVLAVGWSIVPRVPPLRILGDASYSLYLSQVVAIAVSMKIVRALHLLGTPTGRMAALLGCWSVCLVAGVAVWWLVERPLTRAVRAGLDRALRRPSVADAGRGQVAMVRQRRRP